MYPRQFTDGPALIMERNIDLKVVSQEKIMDNRYFCTEIIIVRLIVCEL